MPLSESMMPHAERSLQAPQGVMQTGDFCGLYAERAHRQLVCFSTQPSGSGAVRRCPHDPLAMASSALTFLAVTSSVLTH